MMRVDDLAKHFEQARLAGASIVSAPADYMYGERQYVALDIGGHRWTFSQSIADIAPPDWGGVVL